MAENGVFFTFSWRWEKEMMEEFRKFQWSSKLGSLSFKLLSAWRIHVFPSFSGENTGNFQETFFNLFLAFLYFPQIMKIPHVHSFHSPYTLTLILDWG